MGALLQAQVVMSIVDPEIVVKSLYLDQINKGGINQNSSDQPLTKRPSSTNPQPKNSQQSNSSGGQRAPAEDKEKQELIMQVMNLTNEQIMMLPPEQRVKIIELREQLKH